MRNATFIALATLALAFAGGTSLAGKGGNGGGKPGGGGEPPTAADPVIAYFLDDDLMLMNADGTHPTVLLAGAMTSTSLGECSWSPDGDRIAFKGDIQGSGIYVIGVDGSGLTRIFDDPFGHPAGRLQWSPAATADGYEKIAFNLTVDGRTGTEVYLVNTDGTGLQNLTDNDMRTERYPTWSPDASRLAVEFLDLARVDGNLVRLAAGLEVYDLVADQGGGISIDGSGEQTRQVVVETQDPDAYARWFLGLDWSRSGDAMVYARQDAAGGHYDLWILDFEDPLNPVRLTSTPTLDEQEPSWSQFDDRIAFRLRGYKKDAKKDGLYTVGSDGSDRTRLTSAGFQPDWMR